MKAQLFEIAHATTYDYHSAVTVAHHLLRLTPRRLPRQALLDFTLDIDPVPSVLSRRTDYFGNQVTFITVEGAHRQLRIVSKSKVTIRPPFVPDFAETPPWETVRARCQADRSVPVLEASEFACASPLVAVDPEFQAYAEPDFDPSRPVLEAVLGLMARIHRDFAFDATATTVSTPISNILANRRGVCQDFAHLMIACLRSFGIPARYVSGYLETLPPPGKTKLVGTDASHAWVAFFCPDIGWIDVDPTNNLLPSIQHVTLGWGRDYADVSPVRGVLVGGQEHTLRVGVDVIARGEMESELVPTEV
jgi:transglutaminase-like putative cysteine protease